jgi:hypothetical protein
MNSSAARIKCCWVAREECSEDNDVDVDADVLADVNGESAGIDS